MSKHEGSPATCDTPRTDALLSSFQEVYRDSEPHAWTLKLAQEQHAKFIEHARQLERELNASRIPSAVRSADFLDDFAPAPTSTVGECAGPFVDAKDCPVHRKDTLASSIAATSDYVPTPDTAVYVLKNLLREWYALGTDMCSLSEQELRNYTTKALNAPVSESAPSSIEACYDAYDLFGPWNALTLHLGEEISENSRVWRYVHAFSEALAKHHEAGRARYWSARPNTPQSANAAYACEFPQGCKTPAACLEVGPQCGARRTDSAIHKEKS